MRNEKIGIKYAKKLIVVGFSDTPTNECYAFAYDSTKVYLRNDGEVGCLKCITLVKRQWSGDMRGFTYCPECHEQARFHNLGECFVVTN